MKRLTAFALAFVLAVSLFGCAKKPADNMVQISNVPGTTEEIIEKIYKNHHEMELPLMTMPLDLSDNNTVAYNTALTSIDGITEISVSEPLMGQPYSLVLVRCADAGKAAEAAKTMYDGVDMRKWICVQADSKFAGSVGDLAVFFMVSTEFADQATVEDMQAAVEAACGNVTYVA